MDRPLVYDAELPQTVDFLNVGKFAMVDAAYQNRGVIGTAGAIAGLVAAPTTPATLQITIGVGSIWQVDPTDAIAYGDLGVDNHSIVKQGILNDPVTLTITPPTTSGYSQIYLVQADLQDIDTGLAVVPYLNAGNPSQPFSGPNNSGTSQYSVRSCQCTIALKAGAPAPTGTEVAPAADVGFIGLYTIDVPNGLAQITAPYIKTLPSAPFFPTLPAVPPDVQYNIWTYAADTGTVNALAATVWPPPPQLSAGMGVFVKVANTNTGPATFNLNGLGAAAVHRANGAALSAGDINAGQVAALFYDGSSWQVLNFFGFTATTVNNNTFTLTIPYAPDTGAVNAMIGVFSPALTSLSAGQIVTLKVANTNTGATTMQCNALAAVPVTQNGVALWPRAVTAGEIIVMFYDGANFQLINTRWPYISWDNNASPPAADVMLMVGDQANFTFTNVTAIPFHIASVPGVYEVEVIATANTSQNTDIFLLPNNNGYGGVPFDTFGHMSDNWQAPALPYVDQRPVAIGYYNDLQPGGSANGANNLGIPNTGYSPGGFEFDMFGQGPDVINDMGPFMLRIICCTQTACKMVRAQGGIRGGPSIQWAVWNDNSTLWTSLGTMNVGQDGGQTSARATLSGLAIVKRIA